MEINNIILRHIKMDLLHPFTTSVGTEKDKEIIIVEIQSVNGESGWGESVSITDPIYNEETITTNWHIISDFLIPLLFKENISHPVKVTERFKKIRGNFNAKAALECAIWDLYAKEQKVPLAKALGGKKKHIDVGISVGIQASVSEMLDQIKLSLNQGYQRVKIKIKPKWDVNILAAVREAFPDIELMADANCAYTLKDIDHLKKLDDFNLMMIEQPFAHDDIVDHARLQEQLQTPICLDESIHSAEDARKAVELGSCRIINLKIGRVGGLTESKKIHDFCKSRNIPVWCGGMLESGIGRAHNIALTTLENFILPGDTAPSSHYWEEDIIEPSFEMKEGGIPVPDGFGIGVQPKRKLLEQLTLKSKVFSKASI
ncbi:o-succinylbenzoate synthase [Alteribacillus sp. HJP-4]|uniref:o-succinylbenzoate synthase n=1 Tax=Alteribacillus sp. HJP-4 TaxID=2775394 RepID=UPI0035CCC944